MEILKVLDYSNVFLASYFTDDRQCSHSNFEHTLLYLKSGELEINERGKITRLYEGQCAFIRRDNKVILSKMASEDKPYQSIVLKFSRQFLREYYNTIDKTHIPQDVQRNKVSLCMLPENRPDIKSLFESVTPYFDTDIKPSSELLKMKMVEGLLILLNFDKNLYASLFDFTEPWKIDILDFMNENYMYELSMEEIASFTGRSLATFKRDFSKISDLPPRKWILIKRLEKAHEMLKKEDKKVLDVVYELGFKNRSHFTNAFKKQFGYSPIMTRKEKD